MKLFTFMVSLSFLLSVSAKSMGAEEFDIQPNQRHASLSTRDFGSFVRDQIAGLYYTMSVAGHASQVRHISEFFKSILTDGWTLEQFKCSVESFPCKMDDGYKYYDRILKYNSKFFEKLLKFESGQSADDLEPICHASTFEYLYKKQENFITIIPLTKTENIDFSLSSIENRLTLNQIIAGMSNIAQLQNDLYANKMNVLNRQSEIRIEIINLKYSSSSNALESKKQIDDLEVEEENLCLKLETITAQLQETFNDRERLTNEMKKQTHWIAYDAWFNLSMSSSDIQKCLNHIFQKFKNKPIEILTLARNQEDISSNIASQFMAYFNSESPDSRGHLFYTKIDIDAERQSMQVKSVDPTFNTEQPYINVVFGLPTPLKAKTLQLFNGIAESTKLKLDLSYHFRGDQVINMHDCGRFSTIYLLSELNGIDSLKLSNYDIYRGFKMLESNNYDLIHRTKTETNPNPKAQSRFSYYITCPLRISCDFILNGFS